LSERLKRATEVDCRRRSGSEFQALYTSVAHAIIIPSVYLLNIIMHQVKIAEHTIQIFSLPDTEIIQNFL